MIETVNYYLVKILYLNHLYMIAVEQLQKFFGKGKDKTILFSQLNFRVKKGEKIIILGKTQCGLSSLMKCLAKELQPDQGQIRMNELSFLSLSQPFPLHPKMKVKEQVLYFQGIWPHTKAPVSLSIDSIMEKKVEQLGVLDQYRFSLYCASLAKVDFYFLDEVCKGIDDFHLQWLEDFLMDQSANGYIYASHQFRYKKSLFDRVMILDQGTLVFDDSTNRFLENKDPFISSFHPSK
jgi:ABC-type multidrug transport system ATPase subunit